MEVELSRKCRMCAGLAEPGVCLRHPSQVKLASWIHRNLSDFQLTEGQPTKVCMACLEEIRNWVMFRERCNKACQLFTGKIAALASQHEATSPVKPQQAPGLSHYTTDAALRKKYGAREVVIPVTRLSQKEIERLTRTGRRIRFSVPEIAPQTPPGGTKLLKSILKTSQIKQEKPEVPKFAPEFIPVEVKKESNVSSDEFACQVETTLLQQHYLTHITDPLATDPLLPSQRRVVQHMVTRSRSIQNISNVTDPLMTPQAMQQRVNKQIHFGDMMKNTVLKSQSEVDDCGLVSTVETSQAIAQISVGEDAPMSNIQPVELLNVSPELVHESKILGLIKTAEVSVGNLTPSPEILYPSTFELVPECTEPDQVSVGNLTPSPELVPECTEADQVPVGNLTPSPELLYPSDSPECNKPDQVPDGNLTLSPELLYPSTSPELVPECIEAAQVSADEMTPSPELLYPSDSPELVSECTEAVRVSADKMTLSPELLYPSDSPELVPECTETVQVSADDMTLSPELVYPSDSPELVPECNKPDQVSVGNLTPSPELLYPSDSPELVPECTDTAQESADDLLCPSVSPDLVPGTAQLPQKDMTSDQTQTFTQINSSDVSLQSTSTQQQVAISETSPELVGPIVGVMCESGVTEDAAMAILEYNLSILHEDTEDMLVDTAMTVHNVTSMTVSSPSSVSTGFDTGMLDFACPAKSTNHIPSVDTAKLPQDTPKNNDKVAKIAQETPEASVNTAELPQETPKNDDKIVEIAEETPESSVNTAEVPQDTPKNDDNIVEIAEETPESSVNSAELTLETPKNDDNIAEIAQENPEASVNTAELPQETPKNDSIVEIAEETPESSVNTAELTQEIPKSDVTAELAHETPKSNKNTAELAHETPKSDENTAELTQETPENDDNIVEVNQETPESSVDTAELPQENLKSDVDAAELTHETPKSDENIAELPQETPKYSVDAAELTHETPKNDENTAELPQEAPTFDENTAELAHETLKSNRNIVEVAQETPESSAELPQVNPENDEDAAELTQVIPKSDEDTAELTQETPKSNEEAAELTQETPKSVKNTAKLDQKTFDANFSELSGNNISELTNVAGICDLDLFQVTPKSCEPAVEVYQFMKDLVYMVVERAMDNADMTKVGKEMSSNDQLTPDLSQPKQAVKSGALTSDITQDLDKSNGTLQLAQDKPALVAQETPESNDTLPLLAQKTSDYCKSQRTPKYKKSPMPSKLKQSTVTTPIVRSKYSPSSRAPSARTLHQTRLTQTVWYECAWCNKSYKLKKNLECHVQSHLTSDMEVSDNLPIIQSDHRKPLLCQLCGKRFKSKVWLKNHLANHKAESQPISNKLTTVNGKQVSVPVKLLSCQVCGKKFKSKVWMKNHLANHKAESQPSSNNAVANQEQVSESVNSKLLSCNICGKTLKSQTGLKKHLMKHKAELKQPDEPMNCEHCSCIFATANQLEVHSRHKHRNAGPQLQCHMCHYITSQRSLLDCHLYLHDVKKFKSLTKRRLKRSMFPCVYCNLDFNDDHARWQHAEATHASEFPLACMYCPFRSRSKASHHKHELGHLYYACPTCPVQLQGLGKLNEHLGEHDETHLNVTNDNLHLLYAMPGTSQGNKYDQCNDYNDVGVQGGRVTATQASLPPSHVNSIDNMQSSDTLASLSPGSKKIVTRASLSPGNNKNVTQASLSPGNNKSVTRASLSPGNNKSVTRASLSPGNNKNVTQASLSPGGKEIVKQASLSPPDKHSDDVATVKPHKRSATRASLSPGNNKSVTQASLSPGNNKSVTRASLSPDSKKIVTRASLSPPDTHSDDVATTKPNKRSATRASLSPLDTHSDDVAIANLNKRSATRASLSPCSKKAQRAASSLSPPAKKVKVVVARKRISFSELQPSNKKLRLSNNSQLTAKTSKAVKRLVRIPSVLATSRQIVTCEKTKQSLAPEATDDNKGKSVATPTKKSEPEEVSGSPVTLPAVTSTKGTIVSEKSTMKEDTPSKKRAENLKITPIRKSMAALSRMDLVIISTRKSRSKSAGSETSESSTTSPVKSSVESVFISSNNSPVKSVATPTETDTKLIAMSSKKSRAVKNDCTGSPRLSSPKFTPKHEGSAKKSITTKNCETKVEASPKVRAGKKREANEETRTVKRVSRTNLEVQCDTCLKHFPTSQLATHRCLRGHVSKN